MSITSSFAGDEKYLKSSIEGTITPLVEPPRLTDECIMKFDKMVMTNVKLKGPITINGKDTTMITGDMADISRLTIGCLRITASKGVIEKVEVYATYLKAYSPTLKTLESRGDKVVDLGPIESATFENGTMFVVRMLCKAVEFTGTESVGEYTGGSEPYVPSILAISKITLRDNYEMTGPLDYGELREGAAKFTAGRMELSEFILEHPVNYRLDRLGNTYAYTSKWVLEASTGVFVNGTLYAVYYKATAVVWGAPLAVVKATGEKDVMSKIPFGLHVGRSAPLSNAMVHAIYLRADKLTMNDLVLRIA